MAATVTAGSLEDLARAAGEGDRESLERLIVSIQDRIHGLAVRMLWNPEDAREASQEILIRIVTRLGTFRGASSFSTWVYRVAANYLLTARKSRVEDERYTFSRFGAELDEGLSAQGAPEGKPDAALLLEEVKIGCTLGMLQCLDRPHRLAYVLGEILEMDGEEAARVVGIRPAAFRKRLSRARAAVVAFTQAKCGLISPDKLCRCRRRLPTALRLGRVVPGRLLFASDSQRATQFPKVLAEIRRLEDVRRAAALFRSHPGLTAPADFAPRIRKLIEAGPPITKGRGSDRRNGGA